MMMMMMMRMMSDYCSELPFVFSLFGV
jgi:hypothetical protein